MAFDGCYQRQMIVRLKEYYYSQLIDWEHCLQDVKPYSVCLSACSDHAHH